MNDCEHRNIRIEGSWGANAEAHLICMTCGQTHPMSKSETEWYQWSRTRSAHEGIAYLASLLKEEDRREEDPDTVHTD